VDLVFRQGIEFEYWELYRVVIGVEKSEDDAGGFLAGIGGDPHLALQLLAIRFRRDVDALATHVEFPAVIDAAQPALLVAAVEQRRLPMRAIGLDQADLAVGVAKGDQML